MQQMQTFGNPEQVLTQLAQTNPMINSILALNKKGNSFKQIAEVMAQQKGIDLNNLIQQLQS